MANKAVKSGNIIYTAAKDNVLSLDVVVKGNIRAYNDYCSIDMGVGSIIGIGEQQAYPYMFTYEATEDSAIFSYPYKSEADLVALWKANPKLLGTLVAGSIRFIHNLRQAELDSLDIAKTEYKRIKEYEENYPKLAISTGRTVKNFPEVKTITAPDIKDQTFGWHSDFIDDLFANEAKFKTDVYPIPSIGLGIGLTVNSYALEFRGHMVQIFKYLDNIKKASLNLVTEYNALLSHEEAKQNTSEDETALGSDDISVSDCLGAIDNFGQIDQELFTRFRNNINKFKAHSDRYNSDDATRKLRRELTADFYEIYRIVFIESANVPFYTLPMGIRLFLMFGFVDEEFTGRDQTKKLISIVNSYTPDKNNRVLTMYEWLLQIYNGKTMPSKNEFDMDYPTYLRDLKRSGEIDDIKEKSLLQSNLEKFKFELKNMCSIGNRVTFGRVTSFTPLLDRDNIVKPLELAYLNADIVNEQINRVRNIDFKAFCRQSVYSNPKIGINSFFLDEEVLPYVILMPNIGSRAALWQDIDGKKRTTPARMIISIFHTENLEDTFTKLIAEFRWEMCKTEQGVHWNDVTDPSLTSLYCDFLQFYRKNSSITPEVKEKISSSLKNNSNNFKKVFISDYLTYIKYESQGALRLNKVAREILFASCPFSREIREVLKDNPQFTTLINTFNTKTAQKLKPLQNLRVKLEKANAKIPAELLRQEELLGK